MGDGALEVLSKNKEACVWDHVNPSSTVGVRAQMSVKSGVQKRRHLAEKEKENLKRFYKHLREWSHLKSTRLSICGSVGHGGGVN